MKPLAYGVVGTFLVLLVFFLPVAIAAQTAELAEMVVTSSLSEKARDEVPGAVEVIDRQDMTRMGAETIADALLYATGLMLITGEGRNVAVSLRGAGRNHTLVLLDGRRLAGSFKAQMDVAQLPVTLVERIEVVRGPVSALYGSDAIGGVVNIITVQPHGGFQAALDGRAGFGPAAEQAGSFLAGGGSEALQANLGAGRSVVDDWDGDGALPDDIDDTRLDSLLGRVALHLKPGQQLFFGGEYGAFSREGGRYYLNEERCYEANDRRWGGFAEYRYHSAEPVSAQLRTYISQYENSSSYEPAADKGEERRRLAQLDGRVSWQLLEGLVLISGAELRQDSLEGAGMARSEEQARNSGLFSQADWQIGERLNLIAGLRYDHHEDFGGHWTPRATLSWRHERGRVWIGYGQGFRAPHLNELYVTSVMKKGFETYRNNAALQEETSRSYEIGASLALGRFHGQLVAFWMEMEDLIRPQLLSTKGKYLVYSYENIDEARAQGLELETALLLPAALRLAGQLSYVDSENRVTGKALVDEPCWKAGLTLSWREPLFDILTQVRWLYFGTSRDASDNRQRHYQLTHLQLEKALSPHLRLYLGLDNLFDEQVVDATLAPRGGYLGLNWEF